jgi:hypothetical protein
MPDEAEDYELVNGKDQMVARIRQDGERWWVDRPSMFPDPPLETLDQARTRAMHMTLMTMPR